MKFRRATAIILTAAVTLLTACGARGGSVSSPQAPEPQSSSAPVFEESAASQPVSAKPVKDREGNDITVPAKLERIISTAPSNTEVLVALGLADKLVAVDKYSSDVEGLPENVTQIDFRNADAEAIIELSPDILIASGHNKVNGTDPFTLIEETGICVVYIPSSDSIQGICDDIVFLGQVTGTEDAALEMAGQFQREVEEVRKIAATIPPEEKKTVYFEIGPAPSLYSFGTGTFLNEFIETVGAENIFSGQSGWISPSAETVLEKNPDVILTNVNYIDDPIGELTGREGWSAVAAVKDGAVFSIDTNASSRPSQNALKALRQIAKAVYPAYYE